ncbi:CapA family protein [Streptomyces sp. M10(2022)]
MKLARRLAGETGIDLVIGHHAHVVQPMEKVDGTWVAYGLGNQLARHDVPSGLTEEGLSAGSSSASATAPGMCRHAMCPLVTIPPDADASEPEPEPEPEPDADGAEGRKGEARDHRLVNVAEALRKSKGCPPWSGRSTGWPSSGPGARCSTGGLGRRSAAADRAVGLTVSQ